MRKWYQKSRKRDGWVERKRRFRKIFSAFSEKIREVAGRPAGAAGCRPKGTNKIVAPYRGTTSLRNKVPPGLLGEPFQGDLFRAGNPDTADGSRVIRSSLVF